MNPVTTGSEAAPALVAVAHGSRDRAAGNSIRALLQDVSARRPGLDVRASFIELTEPSLAEALTAVAGAAVVVPLLLSRGYHIRVDVPRAARGRPRTVVAAPFGPDRNFVPILAERLHEAGYRRGDGVVLAAAGSSDPAGAEDVETVAGWLAEELGADNAHVAAGYGSAATPTVADAVRQLRASGCERVGIATYLLAPGHFADRLHTAGADLVTAPMTPFPDLADLVLRRYDDAVRAHPELLSGGPTG